MLYLKPDWRLDLRHGCFGAGTPEALLVDPLFVIRSDAVLEETAGSLRAAAAQLFPLKGNKNTMK